jgi:hypothetical protein
LGNPAWLWPNIADSQNPGVTYKQLCLTLGARLCLSYLST